MMHEADHPVHDAIEAIGRAVARVVGAIAERRGELWDGRSHRGAAGETDGRRGEAFGGSRAMTDLRKLIIDGAEIEVDPRLTLLQACEQAGVEIPRFCYHERLSIAGNCRMCLVEVVGGPPKPAASCAMQVKDLRPGPEGQPPQVKTNSADGQEGARGGDGVPAHQPSARLPDLRPGRRVRPAGPGDGLRGRLLALSRAEAGGDRHGPRAAGRDLHDALHLLHALRAVHHRGRRRAGDGADRARRGQRDHQLPRARC